MGRMVDGKWLTDDALLQAQAAEFRRAETTFRNWITPDGAPGPTGEGGFAAESGRYHLYVAHACPWAHRTLIFRTLKGLEAHISADFVHPFMGEDGWTFATDAPGLTGDTLFGHKFLRQVYAEAKADFTGRVTVPILWDKAQGVIVSNESAEIIRMFGTAFDAITGDDQDFYPKDLREEIDEVNDRVYHGLNNGVYRTGFAGSQRAYDAAVADVFETLAWLEARLSGQRYLLGGQVTEADWRLLPTLLRFDAVYHTHFKCSVARVADYPNLWAYARELFQWPGIAQTYHADNTRAHYYGSHLSLNPRGIVAAPPPADWHAPHGRSL